MEIVVKNIKRIMFDNGVKQKSVAKKAMMSEKEFSNMMHDRRKIHAEDIPVLAAALGVQPNDLFIP